MLELGELSITIIILTAEGGTLYSAIATNIPSPINCRRADAAAVVITDIMAALSDKGSI